MEQYLALAKGDARLEQALRVTGAVVVAFVAMLTINSVTTLVLPAYHRAFQALIVQKTFRDPQKDARMSWILVGHPIVLFFAITYALDRLGLTLAWPGHGDDVVLDALFLGSVLCILGAVGGILLDYTTFNIPLVIVPVWWLTSLTQHTIVAFVVLYGRAEHGTTIRLPNLLDLIASS